MSNRRNPGSLPETCCEPESKHPFCALLFLMLRELFQTHDALRTSFSRDNPSRHASDKKGFRALLLHLQHALLGVIY